MARTLAEVEVELRRISAAWHREAELQLACNVRKRVVTARVLAGARVEAVGQGAALAEAIDDAFSRVRL